MKLKKLTLILAALMFVVNILTAQEKKLPKVAVSTFDITAGAVNGEEAEAITELFISELVSTGKVDVVDRANFDKIIKEMKFQASDWSNKEKTAALGNAVNATMVVRGQIIKLGSRMYLTSTIIDVKTASVLSSAREQFNSLDDIFGLLTNFAKKAVEGLYLKVGDIGPGGGIVFYVEGTRAYEVTANLGAYKWEEAKKVAKDYRGGGYDDWYLPTKSELNLVYQNLKKTGKIQDDTWRWSSSEGSNGHAWYQRFSDGDQYDTYYRSNTYSVRAVRAFTF
jgi:TolB-like protein